MSTLLYIYLGGFFTNAFLAGCLLNNPNVSAGVTVTKALINCFLWPIMIILFIFTKNDR